MTISTRPDGASHRISGPVELIQAIPYLLGFHPADSLVLVGLARGHLVVTARLDLADAQLPGVVADTVAAMCAGGSEELIGAVYESGQCHNATAMQQHLVEGVTAATEACGAALLDVLAIGAQRWRSLCCPAADCCPPEGLPLPEAPSAFAAAATYDGVVALAGRDELALLLEPLPASTRAQLEPSIDAAEQAADAAVLAGHPARYERSVKRAVFAAARAADSGWPDGPPADATVARFVVALARIPLRDAVWMAVDDGRLNGRELWRELARRAPSPYDAAPLFLHGWASWRAGNGALANIAAAGAVESDPSYSAADLLLAALSRGLDPRRFPKLRLGRPA